MIITEPEAYNLRVKFQALMGYLEIMNGDLNNGSQVNRESLRESLESANILAANLAEMLQHLGNSKRNLIQHWKIQSKELKVPRP